MVKTSTFALFALLVAATAPVVGPAMAKPAARAAAQPAHAPLARVEPSSQGLLPDMTMGDPKAPVTVIEYASAACPHCAEWSKENWPEFKAKYIDTGKVHYIFRELLTSPQEYALAAFMTGRCAVSKSKDPSNAAPYFAVVDAYWKGQDDGYSLAPVQAAVQKATGLTVAQQNQCVADDTAMTAFFNNMRAHTNADHVGTTPTFLVNGRITRDNMLKTVEDAIADAGH